MPGLSAAQPIRRYGPPSWMVWTSGEPYTEADCAILTLARARGEVEIIERGRWGPYNVILCWTSREHQPMFFLAELGDDESR
jgi:hypothetical protein